VRDKLEEIQEKHNWKHHTRQRIIVGGIAI
jgi:hypothetical protein